jgi:cell division protein FtsB
MNVDLGIWSKLTRVVIFLVLVALLLGVGISYLPVIRQNEQYRKRVLQLDAQILKELETEKRLRASIEALRNDPMVVERLARETLGYAKPGETVIRFEPARTNSPSWR